ncbi:hypothetical protein Ndes2437A_g04709 [Nannochloris sp. 'desiccata']
MTGTMDGGDKTNLYAVLGVTKAADDKEIRRAFRNLASKEHPDKGGDPHRFRNIQEAYEVLSSTQKRKEYDTTGKVLKTVEEEFNNLFLRQSASAQSHTAGFEAWMRSRGDTGVQVFTADDVVEQFGVVKGSYEAVPLPQIKAYTVQCQRAGLPKEALTLRCEPIPMELEWGQVLVSIRAAPINPADLYTIQTGGLYGTEPAAQPPFVPGHDGIGVVVKTGPGVKSLVEGDWVVPIAPHAGTWRSLAAMKEKELLRLPADVMPVEQAALLREMITAYRLLEDAALKPGDCVILNAGNGTVGQLIIQLCRLLRLRAVAVISDQSEFERTALWLRALGAAEVLPDSGSLRAELDKLKFFGKPKLALDAVGGASAQRLSDALVDGGQMVVYGCISGASPTWNWRSWVFQGLRVRGFNARKWMADNKKKVPALVEALGKLVSAGKLAAAVTEYELSSEFDEALDHAMDRGKNTKVVLKVSDVGEKY